MDLNQYPEIMTIDEVAEYLRTTTRTVSNWAISGKIPAAKVGNMWRFHREELRSWLQDQFGRHGTRFPEREIQLPDIVSCLQIRYLKRGKKNDVLNLLVNSLKASPYILDIEALRQAVFHRESLMSTGIGLGVAVPHVRVPCVRDITMAIALTEEPIPDYDSLDSVPIRLVFLIAARHDQHAEHLKLLSLLSRKIKNNFYRERLMNSKNEQEIYQTLLEEV